MTQLFSITYIFINVLKKIIVITIALLIIVTSQEIIFADSHHFTVKRIRSNELIETKSGLIVRIPHISAPDKDWHANRFDVCYHLKTKQFLQENLVGKNITVYGNKQSNKEVFVPKKIMLPNKEDLSVVMITLGLAQNNSKDDSFMAAEETAKDQLQGLWQRCGAENKNNILAQKKYKTHIPKSIRHNFQEQSSGIVRSIIDNNIVELSNGLRVKIWGLKPINLNPKALPAHKCFNEASKNYLSHKLINKTIVMEKPRVRRDSKKQIERIIYLDEPMKHELEFVLPSIIKDGYGLPDLDIRTNQYQKKKWHHWSEQAIQSKVGAWGSCAQSIAQTFSKIPKKNSPNFSCLIKGNITGTKSKPVKKYHTVNSPWYQRTQAEECFVTEQEAVGAGFVKVK